MIMLDGLMGNVAVLLIGMAAGALVGIWTERKAARRELGILMRRLKFETDGIPPDGRVIAGTGINAPIPPKPAPLQPVTEIRGQSPRDRPSAPSKPEYRPPRIKYVRHWD